MLMIVIMEKLINGNMLSQIYIKSFNFCLHFVIHRSLFLIFNFPEMQAGSGFRKMYEVPGGLF